jgi:hypothetical protein
MKTMFVRLLNTALLLAAWIAAFMALQWLVTTGVLETKSIDPAHVPASFGVVVETRAQGAAPSYATRPFRSLATLALEPGESLHLGTAAYDQADHEVSGSCCIAFTVVDEGPGVQRVELHEDDMGYVMSRYRVSHGQVTPLAHRYDYTLYYLGYFVLGGLLAWLATRPLRRRALAWARAAPAASG